MNAKEATRFAINSFFRLYLLFSLCILFGVGCASSPTATVISPAEIEPPASPTDLAIPLTQPPQQQTVVQTPSATPVPDDPLVPRYYLEAELDYGRHFLLVNQTITLLNPSTQPMAEVLLVVEPNRYPGTFTLRQVTIRDEDLTAKTQWVEVNQLRLPLSHPWQRDERLEISLEYELNLPSPQPNPATRPVPFGYTALQTNLVDWYPFIPPYREGSGWLAHQPGYFGEHLVSEVADYEVVIRIKDPLTIRTTASTDSLGESAAGQLTLAASALATEKDGQSYFSLKKGRSFSWSVSHLYTVTAMQVGDVTVYGYAFPAHPLAGEAALKTTAQALELFQGLFGKYPHSTLSVVEADFLDGMEYDGLVFLSKGFYNLYQGTSTEYLVAIAAHEAAHQWWYALVGNDQALDPWLDEALCTYSEKLFYENVAPEALPWWWTYRIDFYQPSGWINGSIYDYTAFPNAYEAYRNAVYLNGAKFFEELRYTMGEESFFAFLRLYAQTYRHQIATPQGFMDLLADASPQDIEPLLQKYFR